MGTTLLVFHGYTLNGARMRVQMGNVARALAQHVELVYPDAPHVCAPARVDRFYGSGEMQRLPSPHLTWWNANDDGSVYDGWTATCDRVRELMIRHAPVGVLGFSQGAILAASIAAMSHLGELPETRFAVLIAGRIPRAKALARLFQSPISVPSLHLWGDADRITGPSAPALAERFEPSKREISRWSGSHVIPTAGPAAEIIVDFVQRSLDRF